MERWPSAALSVCFNAPAYCACETRYEPSADELRRLENRPSLTAERETEERLLREVDAERRDHLREIVAGPRRHRSVARDATGCGPGLRERACAIPVWASSALLNQPVDWSDRVPRRELPVAEQLRLGHHFTRLPAGDKAAITAKTAEEVQPSATWRAPRSRVGALLADPAIRAVASRRGAARRGGSSPVGSSASSSRSRRETRGSGPTCPRSQRARGRSGGRRRLAPHRCRP